MMIDGRWSVISKWNQITRVSPPPLPLLPDRQYIPFAHRTSLRRDIVTRGRFVLSRNRYWLMKIIRSRIIWKYTSGLNRVATKSNFDKFHFFRLLWYFYISYIYSNFYFNSKSRPSSVKIGQCRLKSDLDKVIYIYTHDIKIINLISCILLVFFIETKIFI